MWKFISKEKILKLNKINIDISTNQILNLNKALYVMTTLKDRNWILIFRQDLSDAFSDLINTRRLIIGIFIIGSFAITLVAFLFSKRVVAQTEKANKTKEIMREKVIETGKLASIGELAAGIAHEINNPIAIMIEEAGWIGDLLEEEEFEKNENLIEFERALKQIHIQGKRCKEITYKLLSFARKTNSRVKDVQINDLISEVISLSAQRAKYNNIIIDTKLDKDLPLIAASPSEMQQVFLNLINNAHDAMKKSGGKIEIKTYINNDNVFIDLKDNGQGISEVNISKIFDPFFTTKPVGKGTGLGLSICYGIIRKMNGEINVKSILDKGTTFSIKIPFQKK